MLAHEMGLVKLGKVSLDGTKTKANASKHHALSWEHAGKLEQHCRPKSKNFSVLPSRPIPKKSLLKWISRQNSAAGRIGCRP